MCLQNPSSEDANVTINYMYRGGGGLTQAILVRVNSRETIDVNGAVGFDKEVSIKVTSDKSIIAERPVYFSIEGKKGGHDAAGYIP